MIISYMCIFSFELSLAIRKTRSNTAEQLAVQNIELAFPQERYSFPTRQATGSNASIHAPDTLKEHKQRSSLRVFPQEKYSRLLRSEHRVPRNDRMGQKCPIHPLSIVGAYLFLIFHIYHYKHRKGISFA